MGKKFALGSKMPYLAWLFRYQHSVWTLKGTNILMNKSSFEYHIAFIFMLLGAKIFYKYGIKTTIHKVKKEHDNR